MLDVGIATGDPLKSIIQQIPQGTQVLGIDINKNYVKVAKQRLNGYKNVEIRQQDFYTMAQDPTMHHKFEIILFSFSYMLMPDQKKALEIAKVLLKENGRIYIILTLHDHQNWLVQKIKPILKFVFTVDFGQITVRKVFFQQVKDANLNILNTMRVNRKFNILLNIFKVEFFELSAINAQ